MRTERIRCDRCHVHVPLWKVSRELLCDDCLQEVLEDG